MGRLSGVVRSGMRQRAIKPVGWARELAADARTPRMLQRSQYRSSVNATACVLHGSEVQASQGGTNGCCATEMKVLALTAEGTMLAPQLIRSSPCSDSEADAALRPHTRVLKALTP